MFKKGFLIELDDIPKIDEDICIEVAKYCGHNNLAFEFFNKLINRNLKGSNIHEQLVYYRKYR